MPDTILSNKGQVVIPLAIRQRLGIASGTKLACDLEDGNIVLSPQRDERAVLKYDEAGIPVLEAPTGAPEMSTETVKAILAG
jgi:AbrB family looped-hinge helix DNA binding protein